MFIQWDIRIMLCHFFFVVNIWGINQGKCQPDLWLKGCICDYMYLFGLLLFTLGNKTPPSLQQMSTNEVYSFFLKAKKPLLCSSKRANKP